MKNLFLIAFFSILSFVGFAQLSGSSTIKNDTHPTYTLPDTVSAAELATWSKTFESSNRYDNIGVQVDISKIGATTIAGTVTLKVKTTANSTGWATIKGGTYTHTVTDASQSIYFNLPMAVLAVQVEVQGSGSGAYKVNVTERHQRGGY